MIPGWNFFEGKYKKHFRAYLYRVLSVRALYTGMRALLCCMRCARALRKFEL